MSSKVLTIVVGFVGLLLALWMGVSVAEQQWFHLLIFFLVAIGIIFVSGGYKFTFHILLFVVLLDGTFNLGFELGSTEQFLVLTCALVATTFWHGGEALPRPVELRHWSFSFAKVCLGAWLFYVALHMSLHLLLFESPGLKNILKSYNATFTPYVFLLFFFTHPRMLPIPRRYPNVFTLILFSATALATVIRVYQSFYGGRILSADPGESTMAGPMVVAAIRFVENVYTLRSLAPVAMLLGIIILTSRASTFESLFWRFLGFGLFLLGVVAALYSGGRATIVTGIVMCCAVLLLRRKRFPIALGIFFTIMSVVSANLFSSWINTQAPMQVSRTLQWILIEKNARVAGNIGGSSEWRWNLANYAIKQWKENSKTIFFGIGFQGISSSDKAVAGFAGSNFSQISEEFAWDIGVKRVATHSMFTDLLVAYGLIGATIYYLLLLALMALTWRIYFSLPVDSCHKDFAILGAGVVWRSAIRGNFSGTFISSSTILLLMILVCALYQYQVSNTKKRLNAPVGEET